MKISKIPMWPLYVADALMFITVFAIALPSIRYAEEMGLGVAFFCCLMVLGAMAMLLIPYWLEYKKDLASKAEHTEEAAENFKIIFDQLSELQLMIADVDRFIHNVADGTRTRLFRFGDRVFRIVQIDPAPVQTEFQHSEQRFFVQVIGFTPTDRHAEIVFQLLVAEILEYERLFYVTEVEVLGPVFPYFAIEFLVLLVP